MKTLTEQDAREMVESEMKWARDQREGLPFGRDNFTPRVTAVSHLGEAMALKYVAWSTRDEMLFSMRAVATTARVMESQAIMLATDATRMDTAKVADLLGVQAPNENEPGTMKAFDEAYRVFFNGPILMRDMRNLPEELWEHVLLVVIKGPNIPCLGMSAHYTPKGELIVWGEPPVVGRHGFNMIPDWWKIPDSDPQLMIARRFAEHMFGARA